MKKHNFRASWRLIAVGACAIAVLTGSVTTQAQNAPATARQLQDISCYFSGSALPADSPLNARLNVPGYTWSKGEMQKYWNDFNQTTFSRIRAWRKANISDVEHENVFYPFAGADFLNPCAMYPDASSYVLIGLEKGGVIPDLEKMPDETIRKGLGMLVQGFRVYIGFNFYRTLSMQVDLDQSPFTGTLPHVLTQLSWVGIKPLAAWSVKVDAQGQLQQTPLARGVHTDSWALDCETASGKKIRITYHSQDISNGGLAANPGFKRYLESLPASAGMFKAASHLPQQDAFSEITRIAIARMHSIVQDDTAIYFRTLRQFYDVTVYGRYQQPHSLFTGFLQYDLRQYYQEQPQRPLDFNFQYDRPDNSRNLMVARRKKAQ